MIGSAVTMKVDPTADIGAYYNKFLLSHNVWLNEGVLGAFSLFLNQSLSSSEFFMNFVIFMTSALGKKEVWFTAFLGVISSYFIIEVLKELYYRFNQNQISFNSKIKMLLLICVSFSSISWTINGRYWLAFWVFCLLLFRFLNQVEKNNLNWKKLLPLLLFIPSIHAGWLPIIVIFSIFILTYRYKASRNIYLFVFLFANLLRPFSIEYISQFSGYLGGGYASKAKIYTGIFEYQVNTDTDEVYVPWFITWKTRTYTTLLPGLFFLMYFFYKDRTVWGRNFENWILVIGSLAVLVFDIPSLGGRTTGVWSAFMLFYLLIRFSKGDIPVFLKPALFSVAAIFMFVMLRLELVAINGYYLIGNIFIALFSDNESIRDLVFSLLA